MNESNQPQGALTDAAQLGRDVAKWTGCEFTGFRGDTGLPEQRVNVSVERLGYAVEAILLAALAARPATAAAGVPSDAQTKVYIALSELPCECNSKRREEGEHLSGCHLFDLTLAIDEAFAAQPAPAPKP